MFFCLESDLFFEFPCQTGLHFLRGVAAYLNTEILIRMAVYVVARSTPVEIPAVFFSYFAKLTPFHGDTSVFPLQIYNIFVIQTSVCKVFLSISRPDGSPDGKKTHPILTACSTACQSMGTPGVVSGSGRCQRASTRSNHEGKSRRESSACTVVRRMTSRAKPWRVSV